VNRIIRMLTFGLVFGLLATALAIPVSAKSNAAVGFGNLYLDGDIVRTNVPPANVEPGSGRDALYGVMGGADGQLGVAAVGPGSGDYHGGHWAVYDVTWNVDPYLLTSEADVKMAMAAGDVTVTRNMDADFRCPIQP
jgi:hypothetical protein